MYILESSLLFTLKAKESKALTKIKQIAQSYRGFGFDIDLLLVARVAERVGLPETTIVNLEIFHENAAASTLTWSAPEHHQLLLKVCSIASAFFLVNIAKSLQLAFHC